MTESKHEQEKDYDQLRYITNKVQQMLSTQGGNQMINWSLVLGLIIGWGLYDVQAHGAGGDGERGKERIKVEIHGYS